MTKNRIFAGMLILLVTVLMTSCFDTDSPNRNTRENELALLDQYIKELISKGYNVDTTASGVYYVRVNAGTGAYPVAFDTLSVKYVGYLLDGSVFDTSFGISADSAWTYVYKETATIQGWDEMMPKMNKNTRMQFIVPSNLAYGAKGAGFIPPYSTLVFVAVMKDIKKKVN